MSKHTPGPWGYEETPESSHWDWKVTLPSRKTTAEYIGIDTDNAEANARLIAAAPMMLEALEGVAQLRTSIRTWTLANQIPGWQNEDALFAACDAAIKAAKGES